MTFAGSGMSAGGIDTSPAPSRPCVAAAVRVVPLARPLPAPAPGPVDVVDEGIESIDGVDGNEADRLGVDGDPVAPPAPAPASTSAGAFVPQTSQ
jgi:hypothetical protein